MAQPPPEKAAAQPPGLGAPQPPGLAGPPGLGQAAGPPGSLPPQPPGLGLEPRGPGAGAPGPEAVDALQKEISGTIQDQVSRLIDQARMDTEAKVKAELRQIRELMAQLDARLDGLTDQLDQCEPPRQQEPSLDSDTIRQCLLKIEQQWGQGLRALRQELHQTVLAHNHNADLMKHHKDTLDQLRTQAEKATSAIRTDHVQQQLQRLDVRLRGQQKQTKIEPLFERLAVIEQRVAAAAASSAPWRFPGVPPAGMGIPPGMAGMQHHAAMGMQGLGAAGGVESGFLAGKAPGAAAGAKAAAKSTPKAAFRCPTDEEVQARVQKIVIGASAGGTPANPGTSLTLSGEATTFVPGGGPGAVSAAKAKASPKHLPAPAPAPPLAPPGLTEAAEVAQPEAEEAEGK